MVPASLDFWRANLNFGASASATGDDSKPTVDTVLKSTAWDISGTERTGIEPVPPTS